MKREHLTGAVLFSVLLIFSGALTIQGNLYGSNTASSAVVQPEPEPEEVEEALDAEHLIREVLQNPRKVTPFPVEHIDSETLWLARAIYSETKRPEEMELVAWVVRNRVETAYRGKTTYRSAVLDPYQFSAFNPGRKRSHYANLTPRSRAAGFDNALRIAYSVRHADPGYRPFSQSTRHFYSEQSMVGVRHPSWAQGGRKVNPQRNFTINERRFRFFEGVS
ncbi:MAG: hypothetical protein ACOCSK_00200 [Rhodothermales bacterium]